MISYEEALEVHGVLIEKFGGSLGIRDKSGLKAALARPFGEFDGSPFYPTPEEKASAILESVVKNHPFVDGNKRTGYVLMRLLLMQFGKDLNATQAEKYQFVIAVASGELDFDAILAWTQAHVKTL